MTDIQFIPQTERDFLASLDPPLAKAGARGRFSTAAQEALAKARTEGFGFIGDKGHPLTAAKAAPKAKTVVTETVTKPVEKPAVTSVPAQPQTDIATVREWATTNGIAVGERGRLHPDVLSAYAAAHGGALPAKAAKPVKVSLVKAEAPKAKPVEKPVKVRTQTVAYGRVRRGDLPKYISEPLLAISNCFRCKAGVAYCNCEAIAMPKWAGGEKAFLTRAEAK